MAESVELRSRESSSTLPVVRPLLERRRPIDGLILPILLLASALYFGGLGAAPVCNPDEGLYAEIPREMVESGDYVIPHCNAARYHDKPPLLAWLTSGLYRIFGVSEFTARFWNAAAGVIGVWAVFLLGRGMFDVRTGLLAAFIYATSAGTLVFSRFLLLDQSISTLLALTLLGAWRMLHAETSCRRWLWSALTGVLAGAAVLTKGLQGIAFPVGILVVVLLWDRSLRRRVRWGPLGLALAAFAIVVVPWHVLAHLRDPESLGVLLVNEQINRFFDLREPRDYEPLPILLFLAVSVAWAFPWCFSLPLSATAAWPALRGGNGSPVPESTRSAVRFLVGWIGLVLWFFTLSQCRLPPYSLPALPAIAILVAYGWTSLRLEPRRGLAQGCAAIFALAATGLLVAGAALRTTIAHALGSAAVLHLGGAILAFVALSGWMAVFTLRRGRPMPTVLLLGAGAVLLCIGNAVGLSMYQQERSFDRVVRALPPDRAPGSLIILDHPQEYESIGGLCFYSRSRIRVLERPGRPPSPSHHGPSERFFLNADEFRDLWNSGTTHYFISDVEADPAPPVAGLARFRPLGSEQGRRLYDNR